MPGIHVLLHFHGNKDVDGRVKPGHDHLENPFSPHQTHLSVLATNFARALLVVVPQEQREQGMPGVWLARSLVRKSEKHTS